MRVYRLPQASGIDSLTMADVDVPAPGRGQALVRMHAASLNYRDLMIVNGRAARGAPPANLVPLSDGAGEVVSIGPEVTRVKPGDRVMPIFTQGWISRPQPTPTMLGGSVDGVARQYAVFDAEGLALLPDEMGDFDGGLRNLGGGLQ